MAAQLTALDPLRKLYRATNVGGQIAIEVQVLRYLRKGRT
jgi:hypothetical protein